MTMADWMMFLAVLISPLIAVQATRWIDIARESRARRLQIFKVLMATRKAGLSPSHVEALNLIAVEFDKALGKDKNVIEAWNGYLAHLNDRGFPPEQWPTRRDDLLVDLLYEMSRRVNYKFDKTTIRTSAYLPAAHGELEDDMKAIRQYWRDLLEGRRILPMYITNLPSQPELPQVSPQQVSPQEAQPAA